MAGQNKRIAKGQVLFKAGDASDGMYIVRSGEMVVYLEKDGAEVVLAQIPAGSMIGEMALFDNKPRSASVKASQNSEVTLISNADFKKLMRQIPKWFVGLMVTLSSRLRITNERLQDVEARFNAMSGPFANILKVIRVIDMLFHSEGEKEGKEWFIDAKDTKTKIMKIFSMGEDQVNKITNGLISVGLLANKRNSYKADCLAIGNRGNLTRFIEFLSTFVESDPSTKGLSQSQLQILGVLKKAAESSAYEQFSMSLEELNLECQKEGIPPDAGLDATARLFTKGSDAIRLVNLGDSKVGLRVNKKEINNLYLYHSAATSLLAA